MLSDKITKRLLWIALFALALRLLYQGLMLQFGGSFDNGSDSGKYINIAKDLLAGSWGQRYADPTDHLQMMPLYPAFLSAIFQFAGLDNLRAVVSVQAFMDSLSVIGIGLAARSMSERFVIPSAFVAAVIPNFLVHSSYVLTETTFVLFFIWGLCALLWALRRHTLLLLVLSGLLFGLALMTRPVMTYYVIVLVPFLVVAFRLQRRHSWRRSAALAAIPALLILTVGAPRAIDHYRQYGYLSLSAQEGEHLLNWFYGCLASAQPCAERGRIVEEVRPILAQRLAAIGNDANNPFSRSAIARKLAIERILSTPPEVMIASLSGGMFRVLMQTGFYNVFAQFRQPATFVSAMPGDSISARIGNFLNANKSNPLMWLWALVQTALVLSRFVQLAGLIAGLRESAYRGATIILVVTIAYFLIVTGPVANPKYRLPFEPPLILLFGMGWARLQDLFARVAVATREQTGLR